MYEMEIISLVCLSDLCVGFCTCGHDMKIGSSLNDIMSVAGSLGSVL